MGKCPFIEVSVHEGTMGKCPFMRELWVSVRS